jgi:mannosyltransferase
MSRAPWPFLLPLSGLYLFLLLFRIDRNSLWLDEVMSLSAATATWERMAAFFVALPEQHPLYYLLLRGWLTLGTSELVLRSFSGIFALGSLWLLYVLATRLFDVTIARISAVLLCFSPFYLYFGQEARMYTLVGFLTLLHSLLFLDWLDRPDGKRLLAYAGVATLGVYTHFFFIFVLAAHLLFLVARNGGADAAVRRLFLAQAGVGVLFLPWAYLILSGRPESQWWKGSEHVVFGLPYTFFRFSLGYSEMVTNYSWKDQVGTMLSQNAALLALAVVCFGVLAAAGARALWREGVNGRFVLAMLLIPAGLALALSAIVILVGERYLIISFPFYLLLLAAGMRELWRARYAYARVAAVAVCLLYASLVSRSLVRYYFDPEFGKEQWQDVATYLLERSDPREPIVLHSGFIDGAFRYYYRGRVEQPVIRSESLERSGGVPGERLWLVLSHAPDARTYPTRFTPDFEIRSDVLFPHQSGIRVLELARLPAAAGGGDRGVVREGAGDPR